MNDKKNIVYLGSSGFPYGLAEVQKIILISRAVVMKGSYVTVICKRWTYEMIARPDMKASGNYEGIDYVYTIGTAFRNPHFFKRNLSKIKGVINEVLLLRKMAKKNKIDCAILSTSSYPAVLYYVTLSKIFGFKTILNYVEFYSGIKKKATAVGRRLNDSLLDKHALKLVDGVFIISEFLIDHLKKVSSQKPYLKIPNLTDVQRYNGIEIKEGDKYFLFCSDAGYFEVIKFVINSFEKLNNTSAFLYLVISGHEFHKDVVKQYIANSSIKDRIRFLTKLTDQELSGFYINSMALLIPLRPSMQDRARFPHKIGEYLAAGSPVISTNYGEVKYYFKDMENMLIAESYDIDLFAGKMQFILDNPDEARRIGERGKSIAYNQFDYRVNGDRIIKFIDDLNLNGKSRV